jgi:hypothetical protein
MIRIQLTSYCGGPSCSNYFMVLKRGERNTSLGNRQILYKGCFLHSLILFLLTRAVTNTMASLRVGNAATATCSDILTLNLWHAPIKITINGSKILPATFSNLILFLYSFLLNLRVEMYHLILLPLFRV